MKAPLRALSAHLAALRRNTVRGEGARHRGMVLVVAGLFTILLLAAWAYIVGRDFDETRRSAEQGNLSYALALEEHVRRSFESAFLVLGRIAERVGEHDPLTWASSREDWTFAKAVASELPQVAAVTLVDSTGMLRMSTTEFPPPPAIDVRDRDYFVAHAENGEPRHVGQLLIDRTTGRPVFTLSRPLTDGEGGFRGVIVASMDVGYYRRFYRSLDLGPNSAIALLRDDGRVLVREPLRTAFVGMDLSQDRLLADRVRQASSGYVVGISPFDGEERLVAFRKTTDYPVVLLAGRSVEEIYSPVRRRAIVSGVGVGLFLAVIWASVRLQLAAIARDRLARRELAESRDFADSVLDSVRSHIAILDEDGRILRTNRPWRDFARNNGLADDLVGRNYLEVCRASAQPEAEEAAAGIAGVIMGARKSFHMDYACASPDEGRWFTLQVTPLRGKEGRVVVTHENITRLKEVEEELRSLATIDSLTGLLNRRVVVEHGEEAFARARRYSEELSLIMIDCDHFKRVNDRYGHALGDRVLVSLADTIRSCIRDTDYPGRLGGEEFLVVLPNTTRAGAYQLALRIRDVVRDSVVSLQGAHVSFTVSLGVSAVTPTIGSFDELLRAADEALYRAKERGRDRVEVA